MSDAQKKYILIIDYNLSRFDDVKLMADYSRSFYRFDTILIRPNPSYLDSKISDHVIDLDPRLEGFIQDAKEKLLPFSNHIIAGFAFSDNAVYFGAKLLEELGLEVDSASLAESAYSKIIYRQQENKYKNLLNQHHLFIPNFKVIHSINELIEFSEKHLQGFVLKPSCEGNNRGVMILRKGDDLNSALQAVKPYIHEGIICEELIPFEDEFSFDGIGHLNFITQKLSVKGKYPVEYGQIVSGNISSDIVELVSRAGTIANFLVGQYAGPFHNEIKLSLQTHQASVIEPNRRPAGMRIWSLAEKVFGVNFYHLWLDRMIRKTLPKHLPASRRVAAIRMLGSPFKGTINLPECIIRNPNLLLDKTISLLKKRIDDGYKMEWFDFRLNKKNGDDVTDEPRDNSDFLAQVCFSMDDDAIDIRPLLNELHHCWLICIQEYITELHGKVA